MASWIVPTCPLSSEASCSNRGGLPPPHNKRLRISKVVWQIHAQGLLRRVAGRVWESRLLSLFITPYHRCNYTRHKNPKSSFFQQIATQGFGYQGASPADTLLQRCQFSNKKFVKNCNCLL